MRLLKTTLLLLIVIYLAMRFSGYGFLISARKNQDGLALQCQYLSARGLVTQAQRHDGNDVNGLAACLQFTAVHPPIWP